MLVASVIAFLQHEVEAGRFKLDDELVIDWFSFDDVHRVAHDNSIVLTDDEARKIWGKCLTEFSDFYDVDSIDRIIREYVSALVKHRKEMN